ncbi:hypothetical protein HMPREF9554_01394, partial [Treponema phagedenis F0421]
IFKTSPYGKFANRCQTQTCHGGWRWFQTEAFEMRQLGAGVIVHSDAG